MSAVLDRDDEARILRRQVRAAVRGGGSLTVVEGAAGLGKTTLVRLAVAEAEAEGLTVLRAAGSPLEMPVAFGIARQLLARTLAALDAEDREVVLAGAATRASTVLDDDTQEGDGLDPHSAASALYWAVANLASLRPLLIVIDDAHVADAGSLGFLHFLARRCADIPVAVVLAVRPVEHRTAGPVLTALIAGADETILMRPLGPDAVGELVAGTLGTPDAEFVGACVEATGGNAFLVSELIRTLAHDGVAPQGAGAELARATAPGGVRRRVEAALAELGTDAGSLARAVAVLGECELFEAAALASVAPAEAGRLARELEERGIFERARRLRFAHPLLANAVEETMSAGELSDDHLAAARLLARPTGGELDRVASHIVAARPAGDAWAVATLSHAAAVAAERGDPFAAVAYLARAVAEPPAASALPGLLLELGQAAQRAGDPGGAIAHLGRAIEVEALRSERYAIARELAWVQFGADDLPAALETLELAASLAQDHEERLAIDRLVVAIGPLELSRRPFVEDTLGREWAAAERGADGDPQIRAILGAAAILGGAPAELGLRLMADTPSRFSVKADPENMPMLGWVLSALDAADRTADALAYTGRCLAAADARGDRPQVVYYQSLAAFFLQRLGRLVDAEAAARLAIAVFREISGTAIQSAVLVETLIDRGAADEVQRELELLPTETSPQRASTWNLVRARAAISAGHLEEALALLLEAGRALDALGFTSPIFCPWRRLAAPVAAQLGQTDLANQIADAQVAIAERGGTPSAIAVALGTRGVVRRGESGLGDVAAAVEILEATPYRRDHADMLSELGGLLVEAGRVEEARDRLREAMAIANDIGALAIVEGARRRLIGTGARPRRPALTGIAALTASELQVARLAADGLKNREVAETLFVTTKTVERHLKQVYAKLGVGGRSALAAELGPREPAAPAV